MSPLVVGVRRGQELPKAPVEIQDEVELYAREWDRHGTLRFVPTALMGRQIVDGTWCAEFTLRANDKRMQLYQSGDLPEPPTETVWFHVADESVPGGYRPLDIVQLGASGVREFLERGNTWSGRGEYASIEDQLTQAREANRDSRAKYKAEQKEASRQEAREKRRWWLKIPFLPVGIDLKSGRTSTVVRSE